MANNYQYTPFTDTNSIRLLYIEPSHDDGVLGKLQLKIVNFDDAPKYESLSYTWGTPTLSHEVYIAEQRLPITANLANALLGIQGQSELRVIWADAICINQNDVYERTQQVQLMATIYHRAAQVLIWLGPETEDVLPALHLLKQIFEIAMQEFSSGNDRLTDARFPSFSTPEQWGLPPFDAPEWHSLIRFFLRPWFTRVWVVQEVRSASSALVICGKIEASWMLIYIASSWFVTNNYRFSLSDIPTGGGPGVIHLPNRIGCHRLSNSTEVFKPSLSRILRQIRAHTATDPRDKVFALVNLSSEAESHDARLLPNYSKTMAHAYRDVSRYIIESGSLDILSAVSWVPDNRSPLIWKDVDIPVHEGILTKRTRLWGTPDEKSIFPSWTPRWDSTDIPVPLTHSLEERKVFFASGNLPLEMVVSSDDNVLILRGLDFDLTTLQTGSEVSAEVEEGPIQPEEYTRWKAIALQAHFYSHTSRTTVFHSALTAGLNLNHTSGESDSQHQVNSIAFENKMTREGFVTRNNDFMVEDSHANDYSQVVQKMCYQRQLFITAQGYMGLGPKGMLSGDTVCILFGGQTPYIIRKKDACWQFIGECYVYGIMHGEAVKDVKAGSGAGELFEIR